MSRAKTYSEKLMHPKWVALRRRLFSLYGEQCSWCGATKRLQIHHKFYEWDREPWDYPEETLEILCVDCHAEQDQIRKAIVRTLGHVELGSMTRILGYIEALIPASGLPLGADYEHCEGIANAYAMTPEELFALANRLKLDPRTRSIGWDQAMDQALLVRGKQPKFVEQSQTFGAPTNRSEPILSTAPEPKASSPAKSPKRSKPDKASSRNGSQTGKSAHTGEPQNGAT